MGDLTDACSPDHVHASATAFASAAAGSSLSFANPVLMHGAGAPLIGAPLLPVGVLCVAPVVSRRVLRRLETKAPPKLFPDEPGPSRQDFVGQTITFRAERTGTDFGQA